MTSSLELGFGIFVCLLVVKLSDSFVLEGVAELHIIFVHVLIRGNKAFRQGGFDPAPDTYLCIFPARL